MALISQELLGGVPSDSPSHVTLACQLLYSHIVLASCFGSNNKNVAEKCMRDAFLLILIFFVYNLYVSVFVLSMLFPPALYLPVVFLGVETEELSRVSDE